MSGVICSYQDCMTRRLPCSSIAFFSLPTDSRRATWIRNSGNKELAGLTDKQNRFPCEQHFQPGDMRLQFTRKTLLRHAVPKPHHSLAQEFTESPSNSQEEEMQDIPLQTEIEADVPVMESMNCEQTDEEEPGVICVEYDDCNELSHSDFLLPCSINVSEPLDTCLDLDDEITLKLDQDVTKPCNSEIGEMLQPVEPKVVAVKKPAVRPISGYHRKPNEDYASDRHFALSLVNCFQRLGARKKAVAKVKILKYLTALEFGKSV